METMYYIVLNNKGFLISKFYLKYSVLSYSKKKKLSASYPKYTHLNSSNTSKTTNYVLCVLSYFFIFFSLDVAIMVVLFLIRKNKQ